MFTKKISEFFKKYQNESWFFEMIGIITALLMIIWVKGLISKESILDAFFDLLLAFLGGLMTFVLVVILSVPLCNIGAVIQTIMTKSPGKYDYPIRMKDLTKTGHYLDICIIISILAFVVLFGLSPTRWLS